MLPASVFRIESRTKQEYWKMIFLKLRIVETSSTHIATEAVLNRYTYNLGIDLSICSLRREEYKVNVGRRCIVTATILVVRIPNQVFLWTGI